MIELVDKYALIPGNRYYVKRICPIYFYTADNYDCIFDRYDKDFHGFVWMKRFTFEYILELELSKIYRYVSKEEFYKRLKEKYDATCLNIILKRLVNDDFSW